MQSRLAYTFSILGIAAVWWITAQRPAPVNYVEQFHYYNGIPKPDSALLALEKAQTGLVSMRLYDEANELYAPLADTWLTMEINGTISSRELAQKLQNIVQKLRQAADNKPCFQADLYWVETQLRRARPDSFSYYLQKFDEACTTHERWELYVKGMTNAAEYYQQNFDYAAMQEAIGKAGDALQTKLNNQLPYFTHRYHTMAGAAAAIAMDYESAQLHIQQALDTLQQMPFADNLSLALAYEHLATLYSDKNDEYMAIQTFIKAIQTIDNIPSTYYLKYEYLAHFKISLAHLYQNAAPAKTLPLLREAVAHAQAISNTDTRESTLGLVYAPLARSFAEQGQLDSAAHYLHALQRISNRDPQLQWLAQNAEAVLLDKQGKYAEALRLYSNLERVMVQKFGTHTDFLTSIYTRVGNIYIQTQQYLPALQIAQKGLINVSTYTQLDSLPAWDSLTDKHGAFELAAIQLKAAQKIAETSNDTNTSERAYQYAVFATQLFERVQERIAAQQSRENLLNKAYDLYEIAIQSAFARYNQTQHPQYLRQIFNWMERTKSIFLLESLQANDHHFAGIPDSLVQRENTCKSNIAFYQQALIAPVDSTQKALYLQYLAQYEQELAEIYAILQKNYPNYYELRTASQAINLNSLQMQLDDTTCIIEFFEGKQHLYAMGIFRDKAILQRLPIDADYKRLHNQYIQQCIQSKNNNIEAFINTATDLYNKHLQPFVHDTTVERVLIIPDGLLSYISFETFLYEKPIENTYHKLPYALRHFAFSYQYSATLWQQLEQSQAYPINYQMLGFAAQYAPNDVDTSLPSDFRQMRKILSPLQGTQQELDALADAYRGDFYSGVEASETMFKTNAPYYGFLHLAMHSVVNEENPDRSALVFTQTSDTIEDDFLLASEIKKLKLQPALVVLSACETGYGKYQRGEGLVSIGRSFMYAGAPSLVMTQWQLSDRSAPPIITNFYTNLQWGYPKDEALRRAKLAYLDRATDLDAHPSLWACYMQLGDTRSVTISQRIKIWWYLIPLGTIAAIGWWAWQGLRQRRRF